jgi:hypothetical protein
MNIKTIEDKFRDETPYIVARSGSEHDGIQYFLASLPDDFPAQSIRDKSMTATRFYVCLDGGDCYMCETSPDAPDFKDAEKYELHADEPLHDQIPVSDYNRSMYKFKKSTKSKLESNVKRFGEFIGESDGFGSSNAIQFASKVAQRSIWVRNAGDDLDWEADGDFTVHWSIEPNYSKSGVNWINVAVQNVDGAFVGRDDDGNVSAEKHVSDFATSDIVIEFEFGKDGSLHVGAIDAELRGDSVWMQLS